MAATSTPQTNQVSPPASDDSTYLEEQAMHYARDLRRLFDHERALRSALAASNRDLRYLEATRTTFVSLISHELRTPITLMQGYLSLLMEHLPRDMPPPLRDFMTVIERETQQLATLINELTDFTRFQANLQQNVPLNTGMGTRQHASAEGQAAPGTQAAQPAEGSASVDTANFTSADPAQIHHLPFVEKAPAEAVVAQAVSQSTAEAARRNVSIQARVPPHLWLQYGGMQIVLILHHLIDNAVKFSPSGGKVLVIVREQQNDLVFEVRDDGPGVPRKHRQEIFYPFSQHEGHLVRSHGGLGLGLALAKRAVHALGGTISVHNANEETAERVPEESAVSLVDTEAAREVAAITARTRGAVFTIRLPRHPEESLQERALRLSQELDQSRAQLRQFASIPSTSQADYGEDIRNSSNLQPDNRDEQATGERERDTRDQLLRYARRLQETLNDERLRRQRLQEAYVSSLQVLADAVEERGEARSGHSSRVAHIASSIARAMGRNEEMIAPLILGAVLHDIGKVALPDAILLKNSHLTPDEWQRVTTHPEIGARLIEDIPELSPAVTIVRHHHERWDGTGYPYQLAGDKIPLDARIVALADAFDRMTSPRAYGELLTIQAAVDEIERCSGTQFDPHVVQAFLRALRLRELDVSGAVNSFADDVPPSDSDEEQEQQVAGSHESRE
jgi:HD-GYP domain-containing protein (c-di-GMP phosphodiesterase class II)/signal transduction histidine kinase